jgi:hypothetical protein
MRSGLLLFTLGGCLAVLLLLSGGCAKKTVDPVTMRPHEEELPVIAHVQRTIPATVAVEGQRTRPRLPLTPDYKPPELTPAEQRVLDRGKPKFEFLKYPSAVRPPLGSPIGPWTGGASTASSGKAGPSLAVGRSTSVSGVYSGQGGASTGSYRWYSRVAQAQAVRRPAGTSGPDTGATYGSNGPAKRIAARRDRWEH